MKFTTQSEAKKLTGLSYLGNINISSKIIKNMKVSNNYTYIIYLAPSNLSGYNVCSHSTPECRLGCLNTSGRVKMEREGNTIITDARIKKTKLFFEHRQFFMEWMVSEIKTFQKKAIKDGFDFSVRLNGTSDIDWENVLFSYSDSNGDTDILNKNIFEIFPDVLFYDYSKNFNKFTTKPNNYHLTYSYTGKNWDKCETLLSRGFNVAVVFDTKKKDELPILFKGYKVIDSDETDFRPNDPSGVICGLRFKNIANKINQEIILKSCFVVKGYERILGSEVKG